MARPRRPVVHPAATALAESPAARNPVPLVTVNDGMVRNHEVDRELNDLALAVFGHGGGARFLTYLENLTINRILPPDVSDAELRSHEGSRWLVGVIRSRMQAGLRAKESING